MLERRGKAVKLILTHLFIYLPFHPSLDRAGNVVHFCQLEECLLCTRHEIRDTRDTKFNNMRSWLHGVHKSQASKSLLPASCVYIYAARSRWMKIKALVHPY